MTAGDIADRIEVAYAEQLRGPLARWFDGVRAKFRLGGGPVPASAEFSVDARAQQPLLERLALPRRLLELAEGHPQRSMLLAHFLWEETPAREQAAGLTWTSALARVLEVEAAEELRAAWAALNAGERRALVAISGGQPPYARSTQRRVGGSRGGGMEHAIGSLIDAGELVEDPRAATGYRVLDPLMAHWVRAGRHTV